MCTSFLSTEISSGLNLFRSRACCHCLCKLIGASVLSCLEDIVSSGSSVPSALPIFLPSLSHQSLSLGRKCWAFWRLSLPAHCLAMGLCMNYHPLPKETSAMRAEKGTDLWHIHLSQSYKGSDLWFNSVPLGLILLLCSSSRIIVVGFPLPTAFLASVSLPL